MTRSIIVLLLALVASGPASAAEATAPARERPPSSILALSQMVRECQEREAAALDGKYALMAQVESLKAQLAAATKRAGEAEDKLRSAAAGAKAEKP